MFLREQVSLRTGSIIVEVMVAGQSRICWMPNPRAEWMLVEQLLDFFGGLEKKTDLQGKLKSVVGS